MATKENEAIVHRFVEVVMNRGNLDAAEDLISPDHVNHDPTAPEVPPGPEGIKQLIGMYRWTFTGTHKGEMMGVEPTGKRVEVSGVEMNHVEDGKITASWTVSDAMGLMRQLGAL